MVFKKKKTQEWVNVKLIELIYKIFIFGFENFYSSIKHLIVLLKLYQQPTSFKRIQNVENVLKTMALHSRQMKLEKEIRWKLRV